MSHAYYQELWNETQNDLQRNLVADTKLKKKGPLKDLTKAKWLIGHLYMNYVRIANKLDACYDQIVHPQKKEVIGRLLDMTLGRLLELKSEMVRIELDDYCFFDNIMIELKLTHQDVEIQIPKYFWRDREKAKEHRRELINMVFEEAERENFRNQYLKKVPEDQKEEVWNRYLAEEERQQLEKKKCEEQQKKMMGEEAVQVKVEKDSKKEADWELIVEAIKLIQRHERARQGRARVVLAKKTQQLKNLEEQAVKEDDEIHHKAAITIQRHWRKHQMRVQKKKEQNRLLNLLGVIKPSYKDDFKFRERVRIAKLRRQLQDKNEEEYREALVSVKEKVTTLYSVPMEEDTVDEIRAWFMWFFEKTKYLPDYPPEKPVIPTGEMMGVPKKLGPAFVAKAFPQPKKKSDKLIKGSNLSIALAGITAIGGSALVLTGHWIGPQEFLVCQKELEKLKKAGKTDSAKKEKMSKEEKLALKKKMAEQERKRLLAEESLGFQIRDSNYLAPLNKADKDYRMTWLNLDESKNYDQRYIQRFVKDEKCWELAMEIRTVVDEMMRLELEVLKDALERDKNPKKKKKKKKKKGGKNKKKGKKKGKKDPTGDRSLDDLFMELFKNGIIRDYEEVRLNDYVGERSFGVFDMRTKGVEWPPSTGDVRELLIQNCILPLGSSRIHQLSPLIKSVCLLGSENSGKEFLARIVCTETASVMFDLTPANVAGKYLGKDGLKMLRHLIEKVSRALQPSVIFVDGAERTFYKKVPKEEKEQEPKRLAGLIKKVVKGIKPPDQVLLLGVSSKPWMAKKGPFLKTYQKLILIPQMDYASYVNLWQTLLSSYHSIPREFDTSCLAKVSDGFSVKTIVDAVRDVLSIQRISRSRLEPYKCLEFLEELLKTKPTDQKMKDKVLKFYGKTDLPKRRAKKLEEIKQEQEKAKKR